VNIFVTKGYIFHLWEKAWWRNVWIYIWKCCKYGNRR